MASTRTSLFHVSVRSSSAARVFYGSKATFPVDSYGRKLGCSNNLSGWLGWMFDLLSSSGAAAFRRLLESPSFRNDSVSDKPSTLASSCQSTPSVRSPLNSSNESGCTDGRCDACDLADAALTAFLCLLSADFSYAPDADRSSN